MKELRPVPPGRGESGHRPEPVRRRGDPFFDALVNHLYRPELVRHGLYKMVCLQYREADRIAALRGWGGAQPHGNDRYQYSLEQEAELSRLLPGAGFRRPSQSLTYRIGDAVIYPMRYGTSAYDCPTSAKVDLSSSIQCQLASGKVHYQPTLFEEPLSRPPTVVWLLFTGNCVESGPLSAYVALPNGHFDNALVNWTHIEPLLDGPYEDPPDLDDDYDDDDPDPAPTRTMAVPEPNIELRLRS